MAVNTKRGQVKINLDRERVMYFDLNALCALEEQGVEIMKLSEGVKMAQVRGIVWAGLLHEDKTLTIEDVGAMITMDNLEEVSLAIGKAFESNGKK